MTGEVAYVADMIKKYEKTAKASGAIMIPQIGIESAPADLVTWSLVTMIREKFSAPTGEVIVSVHDFRYVCSYWPKHLSDSGIVGSHPAEL